jgi:DNA-binding winged helix-turn-helix (wHTH) protein
MIQIGQFKIDKNNAKIYQSETEISVEPKIFQLLLLFIDNPAAIIDRDTIIEQLWSGRFVTDNTINKQIANLRRVLGDDPKQAKYIQTVPKMGYRLICPVEFTENTTSELDSGSDKPKAMRKYVVFFSLVIFSISTFYYALFSSALSLDLSIKTLEVTRATGIEFSPQVIPGTETILFLRQQMDQNNNELWFKNLITGESNKINVSGYQISKLVALPTDQYSKLLVYFVGSEGGSCNIYKASLLQTKTLTDIAPLFECASFKLSDIVFNHKSDKLIFTAIKADSGTNQVYAYDIKTQSQELLRQPTPIGKGNQAIDISPDGEKLLIMSIDSKKNTTLYVLNLISNELTRHRSFNYFITEAIWDHDSTHIYYSGPPPSHQIFRSNIDKSEEIQIVSVSDYLSNDMVLYRDNQLLFSTRITNFNNEWFIQPIELKPANSNVFDIIPALFHQQNKYLFISQRTGKSQIYLGDLSTGGSIIISGFNEHFVFLSMQMSPNDEYLLLASQNTIWRLSVDDILLKKPRITELSDTKVFNTSNRIRDVNWISNNQFVISTSDKTNPNVLFDNDKEVMFKNLSKWRYIFTDHDNLNKIYLVEQSTNKLYSVSSSQFFDNENTEDYTLIELEPKLPDNHFHPQMTDDYLYFMTLEKRSFDFHRQSLSNKGLNQHISLIGYYGYDASEIGAMISQLQTMEGDIHRAIIEKK